MIVLRDYQRKAVDAVFQYITTQEGNPVVVAPTGSGKSILIATFISECLTYWPGTRMLLLTHQKELIEQDMAKLQSLAPDVDMGVFSASLGEKDSSHDVTFASIQSIGKHTDLHFDCIIIDECHLVNNNEDGLYRSFIDAMGCKVIGFTATPYRLGQGRLVEDGSLFSDYIETIGITELQKMGYLSRLTTKATANKLDTSKVGVAMGEYKQKELQDKVDVYTTNEAVADEIAKDLDEFDRHHCMVFCTGVQHAYHMASCLNARGIYTVCVEGSMSRDEREEMLKEFTSGKARAITNCAVLTTGFDYPNVDCIAMMRPTLSPGLYSQILGRGLRIAEGKKNCLVLDFAGNVEKHGPINAVKPPTKHEKGNGVAPMKVCPECLEVVAAMTRECPSCGHQFPTHSVLYSLFRGNINGDESTAHLIDEWVWMKEKGKKEPYNERYTITYKDYDGNEVKEYIICDDRCTPWVKKMNRDKIFRLCSVFGIPYADFLNPRVDKDDPKFFDWESAAYRISKAGPPAVVFTRPNQKNPKYTEISGYMSVDEFIKEQQKDSEERQLMEKLHPEMA